MSILTIRRAPKRVLVALATLGASLAAVTAGARSAHQLRARRAAPPPGTPI